MKSLVANGEDLTVVGIVKPAEDAKASSLSPGIAYPTSLTKHVAEQAAKSEIVKQQLANPDVNVFTNKKFGEKDSENGFPWILYLRLTKQHCRKHLDLTQVR